MVICTLPVSALPDSRGRTSVSNKKLNFGLLRSLLRSVLSNPFPWSCTLLATASRKSCCSFPRDPIQYCLRSKLSYKEGSESRDGSSRGSALNSKGGC